jgi:serine carboxypeptidase-like 19/serine carboxypeptidase-like clade 1
LVDHPKFQSNEVYIGGDSYSGITVPAIVQEIVQGTKLMVQLCLLIKFNYSQIPLFAGNEKGVQPWINLQVSILKDNFREK